MKNLGLKIISLFLTLMLVGVPSFASDTGDGLVSYDVKRDIEKIELLNAIGVSDFSNDDTLPTKTITRGEAASYFAKFIAYNTQGATSSIGFYDVAYDNEYYADISTCVDLKIMSGYNDYQFAPYNNISVQEAITCFIRVLGYETRAKASGGYPIGYVNTANSIKLLEGIDTSILTNPLTENILIMLMYNALDVETLVNESYSNDGSYTFTNGGKYITSVLGYKIVESTLDSVGNMTMFPGGETSKGKARINGDIYDVSNKLSIGKYLGYKVEAYYKETNSKNVKGEIVYLKPSDDVKVFTLNKEDVIVNSAYELSYDDGDKIRKISLSDPLKLVYNNKFATSFDFTKIDQELDGDIIFISNNGDNKYDVVKIEEYKNIFTSGVDDVNGIIYDKYDQQNVLRFDPSEVGEEVFFVSENGDNYDYASISNEVVLSTMLSGDEKLIYVVVCRKKAVGTVTEIKKSNGYITHIGLGNEEYEVSRKLSNYFTDVEVGKTVITVTFDKIGKISGYVITDQEGFEFAYLTKIKKSEGMSSDVYIKAFVYGNEKGEFSTIKCRDKVIVDNVTYNLKDDDRYDDFVDALNTSLNNPIRIRLDIRLEVVEIKTIDGGGLIYIASAEHKFDNSVLSPDLGITAATKVISIPLDGNEENFESFEMTKLYHDTDYSGKGYKISKDQIEADLVVLESTGGASKLYYDSPTIIISDISYALDEEGDEVLKVLGYDATTLKTLTMKKGKVKTYSGEKKELRVGDLCRYTQANSEIIEIEVMASSEENKIYASSNPSSTNAYIKPRVFSGYAYKKHNNFVLFSYNHPDTLTFNNVTNEPELNDTELRDTAITGVDFYIYDSSLPMEKRVSVASKDDLYTYYEIGSNCSRILANTRGTILEACVIIK